MRLAAAIIAVALALCASASAQTAEQQQAIERAERIGRDIYEHDQAAWRGTDAMFEEIGQREAQSQLRGWVTQREGDAIIVTFVAAYETESLYRGVYRDGVLQERATVRAPLTSEQLRLYRARQVATTAQVGFCSNAYNSVTIPRYDSGIVDVYLMPGTTDEGAVMVGGYYRVAIDSSGAIVETQSFSRSCLTVRRDDPQMRSATEMFLFFTHLQTPLPTETHVFINLTQRLPLYVSAPTGMWRIQDGRITFQQPPSQ